MNELLYEAMGIPKDRAQIIVDMVSHWLTTEEKISVVVNNVWAHPDLTQKERIFATVLAGIAINDSFESRALLLGMLVRSLTEGLWGGD